MPKHARAVLYLFQKQRTDPRSRSNGSQKQKESETCASCSVPIGKTKNKPRSRKPCPAVQGDPQLDHVDKNRGPRRSIQQMLALLTPELRNRTGFRRREKKNCSCEFSRRHHTSGHSQ